MRKDCRRYTGITLIKELGCDGILSNGLPRPTPLTILYEGRKYTRARRDLEPGELYYRFLGDDYRPRHSSEVFEITRAGSRYDAKYSGEFVGGRDIKPKPMPKTHTKYTIKGVGELRDTSECFGHFMEYRDRGDQCLTCELKESCKSQ